MEVGPGQEEIRIIVSSRVVVDQDDIPRIKDQGWEETLKALNLRGIPIHQKVEVVTKK